MSSREVEQSTLRGITAKELKPRSRITDDVVLRNSVNRHFEGELAGAKIFNERSFTQLVFQAGQEGLDEQAIDRAIAAVRRQVSIQANFDVRQDLIKHKAQATTFMERLRTGIQASLYEAGEHLGFGIPEDVADRQFQICSDTGYMEQLLQSALEVQTMKHRMNHYRKLGGEQFSQRISEFQEGSVTPQTLLEDKHYLEGLDQIINYIHIDERFEIDGERPLRGLNPQEQADAIEAIRRHLKFVLRTEVAQLAEMEQLQVLSSEEYSAEAKTFLQKAGKAVRSVLTSGTLWGATTRIGTKLVIGGSIIALSGVGAAGVLGSIAAGVAAGYVRERFFARKERQKRHRLEAALGAVDSGVVKSAKVLQEELVQAARNVEQLQKNNATPDDIKAAVLDLYSVISDVQVRLLRSRVGEKLGLEDEQPEKPSGEKPPGIRRPKGVAPKDAALRINRPKTEEEAKSILEASGKEKEQRGPRQDYISFGVENRFKAQQQLLHLFGQALAVVESSLPKDKSTQGKWRSEMRKLNREAEATLDKAQVELAKKFAEQDKACITRAMLVSGAAGGIAAAAMDLVSDLGGWVGKRWFTDITPTLPPDASSAVLDNPALGVSAEFNEDGIVGFYKTGVVLGRNRLPIPAGINPHDIHLEFEGDDLVATQVSTGRDLGAIELTVAPVEEGEQVLRAFVMPVNLSEEQPFPFSYQGWPFVLKVDHQGTVEIFEAVDGGRFEPIGHPLRTLADEVKNHLDVFQHPTRFDVVQIDRGLLLKSAYDGQDVATIDMDAALAMPPSGAAQPQAFIDRLIANPRLKELFDQIGLQEGEVRVGADGKTFEIPEEALQAAGGRPEYLGETAGWRAARMEVLLKAAAEGKIDESEEVVVARAERAARHLLMEHGKYPNIQAAFDEAFGADARVIKRDDVPWIDGTVKRVSDRWMQIVAEMKKIEVPTGTPVHSEAAPAPEFGSVSPLTPDRLLVPVGSEAVISAFITSDVAEEISQKGIEERQEELMRGFDDVLGAAAGLVAGGAVEVAGAGKRSPEIAKPLSPQDQIEYDTGDITDYITPPPLPPIAVAAAEVRTERLEKTRKDRIAQAVEEINLSITTFDGVAPNFPKLREIYDRIAVGSITHDEVQALVPIAQEVGPLGRAVDDAKELLGKSFEDITYQQIDADHNKRKLQQWIARHDIVDDLGRRIQEAVNHTLTTTATKVETTRKLSDDDTAPKTRRHQLFNVFLPRLAIIDEIVNGDLDTAFGIDGRNLRDQKSTVIDTIYNAVSVIDFKLTMGQQEEVLNEVEGWLEKAGILSATDTSLAEPKKAYILERLMFEYQARFPADRAGLIQAGFLNSTIPAFGEPQQQRIKAVMSRLFHGEGDIFATTPAAAPADDLPDDFSTFDFHTADRQIRKRKKPTPEAPPPVTSAAELPVRRSPEGGSSGGAPAGDLL